MEGPVVGAVLAGGRSSRMGTDKAALEIEGRPMAAWVVESFHKAGIDRIVLAGGDPALASRLEIEYVADEVAGMGPLAGLGAVMSLAEVVVTTPCDVPYVNSVDIRNILEALQNGSCDAVCVLGPRGIEPLISAWRSSRCSAAVEMRLGSRNLSALGLLDDLDFGEVPTIDATSLRNLNDLEDLRRR